MVRNQTAAEQSGSQEEAGKTDKIVNVFCPYFILSLLLLAAGWISHHWFGYDIPFINDGTPVASAWLSNS